MLISIAAIIGLVISLGIPFACWLVLFIMSCVNQYLEDVETRRTNLARDAQIRAYARSH